MESVERRLVIAVEGTAALGPYWPSILADYVEKIVRSFCASELPGKNLAGAPPELAVVVFHTHGPYSAFCVQRSRWTQDIDAFLSWLSGISFSGGEFSEALTCEGLSEALMILHGSRNTTQNNQNHEAQKHCILVAASNPYPLPTPVYYLPIQCTDHKENIESSKEPSIADAETVAKSFAQCSVSLSVISPKQLPTLKAIYNAGKRNPQAADPPVDRAKNPQFLVLLSENFIEARTALCRPLHGNLSPNQTILKLDSSFVVTMPGPISNANPSVNGPMIDRQPDGVGGLSTATVKVEPATILPMVSAPAVLISGSQLGQGGIVASGIGPRAFNSVPAMMPAPGMAQHTGVNSLGVTNNFAINMLIGQHPNAQQPTPKYVKIWEGYRSGSASEILAADWPETMQIDRLIDQEHMYKKYVGNTDFLVFQSLNKHGFLGKLKEKKLCAVIQLPSQTLLLSMSEKAGRLIGMLFPADVVVFKPLVSNQQPPMQQQQQLQQQQIQQLQQEIQQLKQQLQQQQQQQQHMHMHMQQQAILLQQSQHQQQHQQMQQMQHHQQQMPFQQQQHMISININSSSSFNPNSSSMPRGGFLP